MNGFGRHVDALARQHLPPGQLAGDLDFEQQLPGLQEDRLVLQVVVLEAQRVPFVDVNELADVPVRFRPVELVAPRFFHARNLAHDVTPPVVLIVPSLPMAVISSRSMSSMAARRSTRRATARRSSRRSSRSTCFATGMAPGVMLNSVSP